MSRTGCNIALIGNATNTLIRFRADLVREMVNTGHTVYAFAPGYTKEDEEHVRKMGAIPVNYPLDRIGINPFKELKQIRLFRHLFKEHRIDTVFCYFVKPVIYGSIAAKQAGITEIYSMLGGLGYLFTNDSKNGSSLKQNLLRMITKPLFKYALAQNKTVFFQNPDDRKEFVKRNLVSVEKTKRIYGSGVDTRQFVYSQPVVDPVTFIATGRLLEEKGVREYAVAARIVKASYPSVRCILLGGFDENPGSLEEREVQRWTEEGIIEWPGKVENVKEWLQESSVFVLPSYREGTPRSTLEALATGRPVITTDVPGCRETVEEGVNGFLVPPRNAKVLAEKMIFMIENLGIIEQMGRESRRIAEEFYDVRKVNASILKALNLQ